MDSIIQKSMEINLEQQKLISDPLRVKIIQLLSEQSLTAKQVADVIEKTAGSVHYHIQKLYKAGIVEIIATKENKGIIEKYYRAKATEFHLHQGNRENEQSQVHTRGTSISLTARELEEFQEELDALYLKYVKKTMDNKHTERSVPYKIVCSFKKIIEEE